MNTHDGREDPADRRFSDDAGRLLRQSAASLDEATRTRLARARQAALDEFAHLQGRSRRPFSGWQPALGVAAAALLAVGLWLDRGEEVAHPAASRIPPAAAAQAGRVAGESGDLDLLLAGEQIEMLEDLEFFDWVEAGLTAPGVS